LLGLDPDLLGFLDNQISLLRPFPLHLDEQLRVYKNQMHTGKFEPVKNGLGRQIFKYQAVLVRNAANIGIPNKPNAAIAM